MAMVLMLLSVVAAMLMIDVNDLAVFSCLWLHKLVVLDIGGHRRSAGQCSSG